MLLPLPTPQHALGGQVLSEWEGPRPQHGQEDISMQHVVIVNALDASPWSQSNFGDIEIEDSFMLLGHFYMVYLFLIPRFGCVLSVSPQVLKI